jgi:hypothetical protein
VFRRIGLLAVSITSLLCSACASVDAPRPWPFRPPVWIQGRWEGTFDHWRYRNSFQTDGRLAIVFSSDRIEKVTIFRDENPPRTYHDGYEGVVWFERWMGTYREQSGNMEYIISSVIARGAHILFWTFRKVDNTRIALYEYESEQAGNYERALADARRDAVFICYLDKK